MRRIDVASGQGDLECLALDLEQLAGREPRRSPRRTLGLDELDARKRRQPFRRLDHIADARAVAHRSGDGADKLRHRERRLLRREAAAPEELLSGFAELDRSRGAGRTYECADLTPAESMLGRACLPLLP